MYRKLYAFVLCSISCCLSAPKTYRRSSGESAPPAKRVLPEEKPDFLQQLQAIDGGAPDWRNQIGKLVAHHCFEALDHLPGFSEPDELTRLIDRVKTHAPLILQLPLDDLRHLLRIDRPYRYRWEETAAPAVSSTLLQHLMDDEAAPERIAKMKHIIASAFPRFTAKEPLIRSLKEKGLHQQYPELGASIAQWEEKMSAVVPRRKLWGEFGSI